VNNIFDAIYRFVDYKVTENQQEVRRHELLVRFEENEILFSPIDSQEKIIIAMHAIAFFYQNLLEFQKEIFVSGMQLFNTLNEPIVNRNPKLSYDNQFHQAESSRFVDVFLDNPNAMHILADDYEHFANNDRYRPFNPEQVKSNLKVAETNNFKSTDFIFLNYRVKSFKEILERYKQYCFYKIGIMLSLTHWDKILKDKLNHENVFLYDLPKLVNLWYKVICFDLPAALDEYFLSSSQQYKQLIEEHAEGLTNGRSTFKESFLRELRQIKSPKEIAKELLRDIECFEDSLRKNYYHPGAKYGIFRKKFSKTYWNLVRSPNCADAIIHILKCNFLISPQVFEDIFKIGNALVVPVHIFFQSNKQYLDMQRRLEQERAFFVADCGMTMICDVDGASWKRSGWQFHHNKVFISSKFRNMFLRNNLKVGQQMPTWNYARRPFCDDKRGHAHYAHLEKLL